MDTKSENRLHQQLRKWQDDLINLSRTNRLLYFRHTQTASLEVDRPGSGAILHRLGGPASSNFWEFYSPPSPLDDAGAPPALATPRPSALVIRDKTDKQLDAALRLLERKTTQEFVDKGLWILYLGLGELQWIDPDDDRKVQSPLLLVPITFAREALHQPFRLRRTDDDVVFNPALSVKLLKEFEIELPSSDELEDLEPAEIIAAVGDRIQTRRGWSVRDRAVITTFTFYKEAMYRDLLDNESVMAAHPAIQMLGLGPDSPSAAEFDFDPVPDEMLDHVVRPEDLVSIRDADSSQRRCILAARDGHSFVMDGPPGTGKSQTITNIIAELISAGRTVLFVSEKAAALDVVRKRLMESSLEEFVLELHSHNATRKAVAVELGRALSSRPTANSSFSASSVGTLIRAREALTAYAQAMNEVRQPLGRSLHEVLGRLSQLQSKPQAPIPSSIGSGLDAERFGVLMHHARVLGRNWAPVERGQDFLWRDLIDTTLSTARYNDLVQRTEQASEVLAALRARLHNIDDDLRFGLRDQITDAFKMHDILRLIDDRPKVPTGWLTANSLQGVKARIDELATAAEQHGEIARVLRDQVGDWWLGLEGDRAVPLNTALKALARHSPPWHPPSPSPTSEALHATIAFLHSSTESLRAIEEDGRSLALTFGMCPDQLSLGRIAELAELAFLGGTPDPPEPSWLNPVVQAGLDQAARILGELLTEFRARQDSLATTFTPNVLTLDLPGLRARFAQHRGVAKLGKSYRADKEMLASCTITGKVTKAVIARLDEAVAWAELATRLDRAERTHAGILGDRYHDRDNADFGEIARAIEVAKRAVVLAGAQINVEALQAQLGRGTAHDPAVVALASRAGWSIHGWRVEATKHLAEVVTELSGVPIASLVNWCARTAGELQTVVDAKAHVEAIAGSNWPLPAVAGVLTLAAERVTVHALLESDPEGDAELLGPMFQGLGTAWPAIRRAVAWAESLRATAGGPLKLRSATAVMSTSVRSTELVGPIGGWHKAAYAVTEPFQPARRAELDQDLAGTFEDATSLLDDLRRSITDIDIWSEFAQARDFLNAAGLEPATRFCIARRIASTDVAPVLERAVLEAWSDSVINIDRERLSPMSAGERDALVADFRRLDQDLLAASAARVVNACAARRPTSVAGAAGIIQRESQKQRKHMPIRELLHRAGSVAQLVKPCFMMSPLAVSQYLPPSLTFDAIIFDEASQVVPSDAVNCVYRGRQLIVAGDEKQLPPSNFFAAMGADDEDSYDEDDLEDFESVLNLCKGAGGMRSLSLNWHYRSQHEKLITYSNHKFYGGRLHTFPGAAQDAPDLGIEVFKVDGVYRRGAERDNPLEAEKVIERVLFHRHHHPDLTLGVVTFSAAQEDAVVVELERQSATHPELSSLQTDDRLQGFFVKNLENVQGDERDIIIFSVGYGPDEHGKFTVQMGPLNKAGGWRRLNVAITRAKRRVEVVTSVLPGDFPADVKAPGVRHLHGYIDFALRGIEALALDLNESAGDAESVFEEEVLRSVRSWGYTAVPQVGLAGYRIDIGIKDPRDAGRFLLGVECDGAMYHSSKVARDRDRLRQTVIEGLGWQVHRIWGIAWFRDRTGQETRLRQAIEAASAGGHVRTSSAAASVPASIVHEEVDFDTPPTWAVPYVPCTLDIAMPRFEMHDPSARPELRRLVRLVIDTEAPVHAERVLRSVRQAWRVGRSGHRIRAAFDDVVSDLERRGDAMRDRAGFLRRPNQEFSAVRVPTSDPDSLRPIAHVPPEELQTALYRLVKSAHAIALSDLRLHVARLFGWARTGSDISVGIDEAVEQLIERGYLHEVNGFLVLTSK